MLLGILYAVATGIAWSAVGIILSRCAQNKFDLVSYSFLQQFLSLLLTAAVFVHFDSSFSRDVLYLSGLILAAGFINAVSQFFIRKAMTRGNHAPVWTMAQASLLLPFLFGTFFFHSKSSVFQWGGVFLILAGIVIPAAGDFRKTKGWFFPALFSFLLYGFIQILYLLPSHCAVFADKWGMRPGLVCAGNFLGWSAIALFGKKKLRFERKVVCIAVAMSVVTLVSLFTFFRSLDLLSINRLGNIGVPVMLGANLIGFELYSVLVLREKNSFRDAAAFVLILVGIGLVSF